MVSSSFLDRLASSTIIVADGSMGNTLYSRGLPPGMPPEQWVLEAPEKISGLHREFVEAGAELLLTCTVGSTHLQMSGSGLPAAEINRRAVELARQAAGGRAIYVGGSIGPTGQLLAPYGPLSLEEAEAAFARQARSLDQADLLVLETFFDLDEAVAAVKAARSVTDLPIVCSLSFDRGTRTMMGVRPAQAARTLEALQVDLFGLNCGRSLAENLTALQEMRAVTEKPLWVKPNAGMPHLSPEGLTQFDTTPEQMAAYVPRWIDTGAGVVGGCCGTTPAHLRQIAQAVRGKESANLHE